jgi:hypothetical protein
LSSTLSSLSTRREGEEGESPATYGKILRFKNEEIGNIAGVLKRIEEFVL